MQAPSRAYAPLIGFVPADDCLHGQLTVRQNLERAAALRLPWACTRQRRSAVVGDVLELLQLQELGGCCVGEPGSAGGARLAACPVGSCAVPAQAGWLVAGWGPKLPRVGELVAVVGDSLAGAHTLMLTGLLLISGIRQTAALSFPSAQAHRKVVAGE